MARRKTTDKSTTGRRRPSPSRKGFLGLPAGTVQTAGATSGGVVVATFGAAQIAKRAPKVAANPWLMAASKLAIGALVFKLAKKQLGTKNASAIFIGSTIAAVPDVLRGLNVRASGFSGIEGLGQVDALPLARSSVPATRIIDASPDSFDIAGLGEVQGLGDVDGLGEFDDDEDDALSGPAEDVNNIAAAIFGDA